METFEIKFVGVLTVEDRVRDEDTVYKKVD